MGQVDIRKEFAVWLAGEAFSEPLNIEEANVFFWNSCAKSTLSTYVVPASVIHQDGTRRGPDTVIRLGIALLQQLSKNNKADELTRQDELLTLMESIEARIKTLPALGGRVIQLILNEGRPPMDPEAAEKHIFLAATTVGVLDVA